jgi:Collagen triple helix repeat (20 copies)
MKSLKVGAALTAVVLLVVGMAQASDLTPGGHEDPGYDTVEARTVMLEEKLEKQAAGGPLAGTARVRRGPRGPRGPRGVIGPRGPQGPQGSQGPAGATGPKGTFGSVVAVSGPSTFLCSFEAGGCAVASTRAECPPGTVVIGGGYTGAGIVTTVTWSAPAGNAWAIIAVNLDEVPVTNLKAVAECASA